MLQVTVNGKQHQSPAAIADTQVTINGQTYQFPAGLTINQALREINVEVPTLCHDDRIQPYGSCRTCIVEVKGVNGLVTACNTQLRDGMEILTHSETVQGVRKTLLGLISVCTRVRASSSS